MKPRNLHYCLSIFFLSLASFAQAQFVSNSFERASSLGKARGEVTPAFTHYFVTFDGGSGELSNNIGIKAGYGISESFDLKLRYEHFFFPKDFSSGFSMNYFSLVPKFSVNSSLFAFQLPLSLYHVKNSYGPVTESQNLYSISPQLLKTFGSSNTTDFTATVKGDYMFTTGDNSDSDFLLGLNLGAGLSSDLRKWAIRPEAGILFKPGENGIIWNVGLGLQFLLSSQK